ncbi:MAG TPA: outer membrane beta-barrel protein [Polyangiaceae bacterium]|nr:outer membrane beta-barrel protein [Polyangiaceae bacterium]
MRLAALLLGGGVWLAAAVAAPRAHAFEREWHLGAAVGAAGGKSLKVAPALGAYAAYGVSDVFDVRLEMTLRGYEIAAGKNPYALSTMAGLTYKLDVLRWVPWAGVYVGYLAFLGNPPPDFAFKKRDVALGVGAGLDYAFSRDFGCGATVRVDDSLAAAGGSSWESLLRVEYRWGW